MTNEANKQSKAIDRKIKQSNETLRVKVECAGSSLRLRFTYKGQRRALGLGLKDTPDNRAIALQVASRIHLDIAQGTLSEPLSIYLPNREQTGILSPSTRIPAEGNRGALDIQELIRIYSEYRRGQIKDSTHSANYQHVSRLLSKIPSIDSMQALNVREELLKVTTPDQTRRALMIIAKAARWAVQHGKMETNPYEGMYRDMPRPRYLTDPQPNPFSETDAIWIQNKFLTTPGHNHYWNLVAFLFATGCRPGEAIALRWSDIHLAKGVIHFRRTMTKVNGKAVESETTKTNQAREFPLPDTWRIVFPENRTYSGLIFLTPTGKPINYDNFVRRHWKPIVDPIKPGTTPYNCRDTFITRQCLKHGIPTQVVARWVGNSVETIEKYYLGGSSHSDYKPGV